MIKNIHNLQYEKTYGISKITPSFLVTFDNSQFILKSLAFDNDYKENFIQKFTEILQLSHPNLSQYSPKSFISENECHLFSEYLNCPSLKSLINSPDFKITESQLISWSYEILSALEYLHLKGFTHLRLSLDNIFIKENKIKIKNYAINTLLLESGLQNENFYKINRFTPPEIFEGKMSHSADIWILGVILYEICTNSELFKISDTFSILKLYKQIQNFKPTMHIENFSAELCDLINSMLILGPDKRPSAHELREFPIFKKIATQPLKDNISSIENRRESICDDNEIMLFEMYDSENIEKSLIMLKEKKKNFDIGITSRFQKAKIYHNIGSLYMKLGFYGKALCSILKSVQIYELLTKQNTLYPLALLDISNIQNILKEPEQAYSNINRAINYLEKNKLNYMLPLAYGKLAEHYIEQFDYAKSENSLNKANTILEKLTENDIGKLNLIKSKLELAKNNPDISISFAQKSYKIYLEIPNSVMNQAESELTLAEAYSLKNDKIRSVDFFEKAIQTLISGKFYGAMLGQAYEKLGKMYANSQEFEKSLQIFEKAADLYRLLQNWVLLENCYSNVAEILENYQNDRQNEYTRKVAELCMHTNSINKHEKQHFIMQLIKSFVILGRDQGDHSNWTIALSYFENALKLTNEIKDDAILSEIYMDAAYAYYKNKLFEKSINYAEKAIGLTKETDDFPKLYLCLGKNYGKLQEWDKSANFLRKAIEVLQAEGSEDFMKADCLLNLAVVNLNLKKQLESIENAKSAIKIYESTEKDSKELAAAYRTLGNIYGNISNYQSQINATMKAIGIYRELEMENSKQVASCYTLLACAFGNSGNKTKKYEFARKAVNIFERQKNKESVESAYAYITLSTTYGLSGDWKKQEDYSKLGITIYNKLHIKSKDLAFAYMCYGGAIANQGKIKESLEFLEKSLQIYELLNEQNTLDFGNICYFLGIIYQHEQNFELSKKYAEKSYSCRKNILGEIHIDTIKIKSFIEEIQSDNI